MGRNEDRMGRIRVRMGHGAVYRYPQSIITIGNQGGNQGDGSCGCNESMRFGVISQKWFNVPGTGRKRG